jgi:hypothetical protein
MLPDQSQRSICRLLGGTCIGLSQELADLDPHEHSLSHNILHQHLADVAS